MWQTHNPYPYATDTQSPSPCDRHTIPIPMRQTHNPYPHVTDTQSTSICDRHTIPIPMRQTHNSYPNVTDTQSISLCDRHTIPIPMWQTHNPYPHVKWKKWKCVNFKCYSSKELITLNTLHEVVPTWYSFHSWVDWSNSDKVSCSRRKHIDAGIEPSTFVS